MSLTLYYHPLSSFCWKALIALYETETPFTPHLVNLQDATSRAEFEKVWPIAKFPVLRDDTKDLTIPESSIIIEYLAQHHPGKTQLLPKDADLAREVRLRDRFYDQHLHQPMQKVVGDRNRPAESKDPQGVDEARKLMRRALDMIERQLQSRVWSVGEAFSMADCSACPALFYANKVMPFADTHPAAAQYLQRLMQRPAFARVLEEAQPYFKYFPQA
jgi:glutathione S-transferase